MQTPNTTWDTSGDRLSVNDVNWVEKLLGVFSGSLFFNIKTLHNEMFHWDSLTVLVSLFRDLPNALPVFIGENEAKKGYTITQMGDNIFAAVL